MLVIACGAPARAGYDTVLNVPPGVAPASIDSNTQLNLFAGGSIGTFFDVGNANGMSTDVQLNISGGSVGLGLDAHPGSEVNLVGGVVGDIFRALEGSAMHISGGDFRLDGEPIAGLQSVGDMATASPPEGSLLSGTLSGGTPFAFSTLDGDMFAADALTLEVTTLPAIGAAFITVPDVAAPQGIRESQTLQLETGGTIGEHFSAGSGSTIVIAGGQVGDNLELVDATASISGGMVGDRFDIFGESTVEVTGGVVGSLADVAAGSSLLVDGGSVGGNLDVFAESQVTLSGGSIGERFRAFDGSIVNINGGAVGPMLDAFDGSEVNITGGSIGPEIDVLANSAVNIRGSEFLIDGVEISDLNVGQSMPIPNRNVSLSGTLTDGTPFNFDLNNDNSVSGQDFFDDAASITITLTHPGTPGDYNDDGVVNAADYVVWRNHQGTAFELPGRDPAISGNVGAGDYEYWVENFGSAAGTGEEFGRPVPEPASASLLALLLVAIVPKCVCVTIVGGKSSAIV